ncbi:HvfC/BufC N-terminal domain-containing protein [Sphingopyxis solisilvae]|uniref:HvfC/BufC N-terminal domain-containing protein n=1 Tax=Sphingopyxis solisilvae TaxID=1886788 RepID=UPI001892BD32|nr:DNA-binding domain-containing protein [Sphingopyxis solisilvae]
MLECDQRALAATLLHGPGHLPDALFAGDEAAVLRGLRVHANTISHARLVALEETFPRTRVHLGEGPFNRLSRAFLDAGGAEGRSLTDIGAGFADWLGDSLAAELARVEWAWLESYNAADALALGLADLAGCDEATLFGMAVRLHPAARTLSLATDAAPLVDPALRCGPMTLLFTRPAADVQLWPTDAVTAGVLDLAKEISQLGNLLARLAEDHPDGGAALAALIDAGAFERLG